MCGRFSLIDGTKQVLSERFGVRHITADFETAAGAPKPVYNAAPSFVLPVILDSFEQEGEKVLTHARWGFEGSWGKHPFANARLDTITQRPTFKEAFAHRHCLVPANSFFEWKREKSIKQPYLIHLKDEPLFAMAGIWEPPQKAGDLPTFAILTTESNEMMSKIHDRMPIMLRRSDEGRWLTTYQEVLPFAAQYPSEQMELYPVTTKVNKVPYNEPDAIEPIAEPSLGL